MNPSRRLGLTFAILSLAVSALAKVGGGPPAYSEHKDTDIDPDRIVELKDLATYTDPQFAALAASQPKKAELVGITKDLFNKMMHEPNGVPPVPQDAVFRGENVNHVRDNVAHCLEIVEDMNAKLAVARTDREKRHIYNEGFAAMTAAGLPVPYARAASLTPTEKASGYFNSQTSPDLTKENHYRSLTAGSLPDQKPAGPSFDMGLVIMKAADQAKNQYSHDHPEPTPEIPATPTQPAVPTQPATPAETLPTAGNGATRNGPTIPDDAPIPTSIGNAIGVNDPNSPRDAMSDAQERYRRGDVAGGLEDATRAINLGGGAPAFSLRGGMELDQKDYAKATADASRALELDANNREAIAISHLAKVTAPTVALPGGPSRSEGESASVPGASAANLAASANATALAAARAAGMSGAQAKKEAQGAMKLGDLDGALVYVNRALSQNPNNPDLLNMRAAIEARQGDYESSITDAKAGLKLAPGNKTILQTLGYAQVRGKHYKDAEGTASAMLAIDPVNPYAFALRAHAEANLGEKDAMMADINKAAALDPRYASAAAELAKIVQLPTNDDVLFLFPGEVARAGKIAAQPAPARGRRFGALVAAALAGGLLLALGLMKTVVAPITEKLTSVFTRRPGAAVATEDLAPASVNGLVPGLIRGQYEVSRQIGAGGMGMVFEGTDRSLGRRVAIKKMRDELKVSPQERARFVIEAKTVAALHHANIVDIYAIAEEGPDVFLIFEYVDGKTVHELVQLNGRLPLAKAAGVVRAVAGALDYAHAHGVIHRDMKPSNVMLDATGRVKVMDFGIARMAKDSATRYSMTNTVVGTPPYMAPEQEQGHVRKESDVYALAVCAYEMLTGKLPFIGIGAGMLMNKINMSYVAPSRAAAGVPEALDEVFTKAFQADPDQRYRTPKEFSDALEASLGSAAKAG